MLLGFIVAYFIGKRVVRTSRRKKLLVAAFAEEYVRIIEKNVPLYGHLSDSLKQELQLLSS